MLGRAIVIALAAVAALAAPASADLGDEVTAGRTLAGELQAGATACQDLSADDFEHVGEFVMSRMTGSARAHTAMNDRMRAVMGADNAQRMRTLMGQRYAGCAAGGAVGPMMGQRMMRGRGWTDDSTWGPMMNSRAWDWMRDGNWQHMNQADWERVSAQWMGPGMMRNANDGWHTRNYALVGVAVTLAAALLVALLALKPWSRWPRAAATGD
jgi:hypothetical protein